MKFRRKRIRANQEPAQEALAAGLRSAFELPILAGVTRAVVAELYEGEVVEGVFPLADLLAADEAFLSASNREVMPVVTVDGRTIGDGKPGSAAQTLQQALRARAAATL